MNDGQEDRPRLSVAMSTYNGARYVREQLESIAGQIRLPDELVICDDCSTDDTPGVIESFAKRAPFPVRLHVNHTNVGARKSFERAIMRCNGDLIALCDQDDVWVPAKLLRSALALQEAPSVGLVFTDADVVDEHLRPLGYSLWESIDFSHEDREMFRHGRALDVLLAHNVVAGMTMVFRSVFRELVLPILDDHPFWAHDGWIAAAIAAVTDIAFIDEALVLYRQHPGHQIGAGPPQWFIPVSTSFARIEHLRKLHQRLAARGRKYESAAQQVLALMWNIDLRRASRE